MRNRYALCVGVSNGLPYAEKDAENMYDLFQKLNFKEVVLLLNDNKAGLSTIKNKGKRVDREVVKDWIDYFKKKKTDPGDRDLFVFYYSGHGTQFDFEHPALEEPNLEALYLHEQLLPDKLLKTYWHGFHNVDVLILLDTCYAYGYAKNSLLPWSAIGKSVRPDDIDPLIIECTELLRSKLGNRDFIELLNKDPDVKYFVACDNENGVAYNDRIEESGSGNSYFTYAMLKHFPSYEKFNKYYDLFKAVTDETIKLSYRNQTPKQGLRGNINSKKPF